MVGPPHLPDDLGDTYPVCLDLFCGVGGVCRTLQSYGARPVWDVIGIDINGSKADTYPGYFVEHDLREGLPAFVDGLEFDIAWASPACTFATALQFQRSGENLIPLARDLLKQVDAAFTVIENVPDAREHLDAPSQFCGGAFGLGVQKHRLFETSFFSHGTPCNHPDGGFDFCIGDREAPVEEYRAAHGFAPTANIRTKQLRECIPPAYVEELQEQYLVYECGASRTNGRRARESNTTPATI